MASADNAPELFLTDQAVGTELEDEFQRYPFARQIATTIRSRQHTASLVLGLYGKWGSGKSSVLNFIVAELADSNVLTMVFNPWLFSGEEQLLLGFFTQLSEIVAPLDSADTQAAIQQLTTHGKKIVYSLALFKLEATQEQVQSAKSLTALEGFKHKLSELLRNTSKRILIIIDDLDRLDKQEVQAMLRLVKLTGDFEFTTYLLAFDDAMVARALGERYPGGGKAAGRRFLEKIIQVPLRLPVIQQEVMARYFVKQLQRSLVLTDTRLSEVDLQRLHSTLASSVLTHNINPRDISRYINTLMVALPMLRDEANMVDLMLIEALKMFYPNQYKLVASSSRAVTGILDGADVQDAHKRWDSLFGENAANLGTAKSIIFNLFPAVNKLYQNYRFHFGRRGNRTEEDLYREKSIASSYYFKRYFSYAVQEGEIPDISFAEMLAYLREQKVPQASEMAVKMIERASDSELLHRLEIEIAQVRPEHAVAYCSLIINLSPLFSPISLHERSFHIFPRVTRLLLFHYFKLVPQQEKASLGKNIIQKSDFKLSYQLLYDIDNVKPWEETTLQAELEEAVAFFTLEYYIVLAKILIARALNDANGKPLYNTHASQGNFLFLLWKKAEGSETTDNYLQAKLNEAPDELPVFLRYMSPVGSMNGVTMHNHLTQEYYEVLSTIVNPNYIYQAARKFVGDTPLLPYNPDIFSPPSDEERVHEFIHLHDKSIAGDSAPEETSDVVE
jgi:hypothetical protein